MHSVFLCQVAPRTYNVLPAHPGNIYKVRQILHVKRDLVRDNNSRLRGEANIARKLGLSLRLNLTAARKSKYTYVH